MHGDKTYNSFVCGTPRKFSTAKLSIRKPGSSSLLVICDYSVPQFTCPFYIQKCRDLLARVITKLLNENIVRTKHFNGSVPRNMPSLHKKKTKPKYPRESGGGHIFKDIWPPLRKSPPPPLNYESEYLINISLINVCEISA